MTTINDENTAQDPKWLSRLAALLPNEEYVVLAARVRSLRAATDVVEDAVAELRRAVRDGAGFGAMDPVGPVPSGPCRIPPHGWFCTRDEGHEPPCAAVPMGTPVWDLQSGRNRASEPEPTDQCPLPVGGGFSGALRSRCTRVSGHEGACKVTYPNDSSAATNAFDAIAKLCGVPEWGYPGQLVRDVKAVCLERDELARRLADMDTTDELGVVIDERSPTADNHLQNENGLDLPAVVQGRDGLSRDAVADAIFAQQSQEREEILREADRHIEDAAKVELKVTDTLRLPWSKAIGIYDSDGPALPVTIRACSAEILVAATDAIAINSGRTRYRVHCNTCDLELHRATTGTTNTLVEHLREKHNFDGEVAHTESK